MIASSELAPGDSRVKRLHDMIAPPHEMEEAEESADSDIPELGDRKMSTSMRK